MTGVEATWRCVTDSILGVKHHRFARAGSGAQCVAENGSAYLREKQNWITDSTVARCLRYITKVVWPLWLETMRDRGGSDVAVAPGLTD